jgi:hypothetical protein
MQHNLACTAHAKVKLHVHDMERVSLQAARLLPLIKLLSQLLFKHPVQDCHLFLSGSLNPNPLVLRALFTPYMPPSYAAAFAAAAAVAAAAAAVAAAAAAAAAESNDVACWFGAARAVFTPGISPSEFNDACQVFGKTRREGEKLFQVKPERLNTQSNHGHKSPVIARLILRI